MTLLIVSFIAGVLTVLAPCILPLLPVIIGSSVGSRSRATPFIVIGSLALSILLFTYLLKASTALIAIPTYVWSYLSGGIFTIFGIILLFPQLWETLPFIAKTNTQANQILGTGYKKKSIWGDILIGIALGPIFSSCSPTYFVILATVLPASFFLGTLYLIAYIVGLVFVLTLIALLGQRLTAKLQLAADSHTPLKRGLGVLFLIIGLLVMTGYDKKFETWVLDNGYISGVLDIEQTLLEQTDNPTKPTTTKTPEASFTVPSALARFFPNTDFSNADQRLANALSGGPAKDGIPALDNPEFVPLTDFDRPDDIQTIVLNSETDTKVYPYNILTWHEIVNDEFDGVPVAVTFCPLCGSAVVYNRTLPDGTVSTFGVSGSLLESNMIMYDRATETLWQQSTGSALAGTFYPASLDRVSFQLLTLGEVRSTYPHAHILSEHTGYWRDYARNPYAGYESSERFVFAPSTIDTSFPVKTIMVVFTDDGTTYTTPWLTLRESKSTTVTNNTLTYTLTVSDDGTLTITDINNNSHSFYFEMWFSVAVQHDKNLVVFE